QAGMTRGRGLEGRGLAIRRQGEDLGHQVLDRIGGVGGVVGCPVVQGWSRWGGGKLVRVAGLSGPNRYNRRSRWEPLPTTKRPPRTSWTRRSTATPAPSACCSPTTCPVWSAGCARTPVT